jgi:hypothetical protein
MRHQAIYELYPNVVQIKGNQQPTEQWDKDGNIVIIDENAVSTKESELQTAYDNQEYARNRQREYPSVQDLVVALYDTDDKTAIDEKRAEIKLKYPKPGA